MGDQSLRDQGNAEFKQQNFLKAAALYTKAIKEDPDNGVLYSNRSAALLKLNKISKALTDAETCIRLKPDWEKGYFRKGAVLEATDDLPQALAAYEAAAKLSGVSKAAEQKIHTISKALKRAKQTEGFTFRQNDTAVAAKADASGVAAAPGQPVDSCQAIQAAQGPGEALPFSDERVDQFCQQVCSLAMELLQQGGPESSVFFLPGRKGAGETDEQLVQVGIKEAFASPDTYSSCMTFLRKYAADNEAHAACGVIPKSAFSQVWKGKPWEHQDTDGIFVQLDCSKTSLRRVCFIPSSVIGTSNREPEELGEEFRILEPLFR